MSAIRLPTLPTTRVRGSLNQRVPGRSLVSSRTVVHPKPDDMESHGTGAL